MFVHGSRYALIRQREYVGFIFVHAVIFKLLLPQITLRPTPVLIRQDIAIHHPTPLPFSYLIPSNLR